MDFRAVGCLAFFFGPLEGIGIFLDRVAGARNPELLLELELGLVGCLAFFFGPLEGIGIFLERVAGARNPELPLELELGLGSAFAWNSENVTINTEIH